jgi:hypothetical protein
MSLHWLKLSSCNTDRNRLVAKEVSEASEAFGNTEGRKRLSF